MERVPPVTGTGASANTAEEPFWKNCWNWNLCDAAYGCLVLDINGGRVSADLKSQGFNYAYRRTGVAQPQAASVTTPAKSVGAPSTSATPAPAAHAANAPVQTATPKTPITSEPKTPTSDIMSPATREKELQGNGHAATNERAEQRKKERKEREKERKERQRAEKEKEKQAAASGPGTEPSGTPVASSTPKGSGKATPDPSSSTTTADGTASVKAAATEGEPGSPLLSGGDSSGVHTPTSRRPARNPWTLFMKLPAPTSDQELRDFFQEAKEGITKIVMPPSNFGRGRIAYVEFGDEEAMKEGLSKHDEVCFCLYDFDFSLTVVCRN